MYSKLNRLIANLTMAILKKIFSIEFIFFVKNRFLLQLNQMSLIFFSAQVRLQNYSVPIVHLIIATMMNHQRKMAEGEVVKIKGANLGTKLIERPKTSLKIGTAKCHLLELSWPI